MTAEEHGDIRVLLIGASGVFGSKLAELAARETGMALTLAGRRRVPLEMLGARLDRIVEIRILDRDAVIPGDLAGYDVVIDAAGPFQSSHMRVIDAAIAAGVDYIDLADGREFVANIGSRHDAALAANVSVLCGASSIPALSHAVIDDLVAGWTDIESVRVGIYPGNRAPRGRAVVEAILSYVGKPVRVFREAQWQFVPGWGQTHREHIPGLGHRWASVCDTPEQDLLVERYRPTRSAEFFAGMELSILHLGLAALAVPVRWGWIASLRPFAGALLWMAKLLVRLGSDRGAMTVGVTGRDHDGNRVSAVWRLSADGNRGPYVPVLAALALLRRYRDGKRPPSGARACSGILTLEEYSADFASLGIQCRVEREPVDTFPHREPQTMVKVSSETI